MKLSVSLCITPPQPVLERLGLFVGQIVWRVGCEELLEGAEGLDEGGDFAIELTVGL